MTDGQVLTSVGAIPRASDLLNIQRRSEVMDGTLAKFVFGTSTVLDGLDCTPAPLGIGVVVAPGAIFQAGVIDQTGIGTVLNSDMRALQKFGINLDPVSFALAAPTVAGQAINYLIECTWGFLDTDPRVISYYNAAAPGQPLPGPNGTGAAQNTTRAQFCEFQLRAGAPAIVGTQATPAVDAGWTGIWIITVRAGETFVVQSDIMEYPGAPFVRTKLQNLASLQSAALTGTPTAPTVSYTDNSTSIATTQFVQNVVQNNVTARNAKYQSSAVNSVLTNAGAKLDGWLDAKADFECRFDGVTDDTAAYMNFWNAINTLGIEGRMPPGRAILSGVQIIQDVAASAHTGVSLYGAGGKSTVLDVSACTGSPQMLMICSAGSGDAFYSTFKGYGIQGSKSGGITFQMGREYNTSTSTYPDAFNLFDIELVINNNSPTGAAAARLNYVVNSDIELTCNCGGVGIGTAAQFAGVCFSNIYGSYGNAHIGIQFVNYSFGNSFFGIDIEVVDICIQSDSPQMSSCTWHGGQFVWNTAYAPVVLNECGGQLIFVGGNWGSAAPSISGAAAAHGCMIGFPVGSLALGGMNIVTTNSDAGIVLSAPASNSTVTVHNTDGVATFVAGVDPAKNYHVDRYVGGALQTRPFNIDNTAGLVTVPSIQLTNIGINGHTPVAPMEITGSRSGATVAVLATLLTFLDTRGDIINHTTD
jgi:hypothetical protein